MKRLFIAAILSVFVVSSLFAAEAFVWRTERQSGFSPQETLKFNVRWQFITVGSASMEVRGIDAINGRLAYHIYTEAKTAAFFDNFYKVRDTNESWIDIQSLCSLQFASHISEAGHRRDETLIFHHPRQQYSIVESSKSGTTPLWVQDVLSALYYIRCQELVVGKEFSVDAQSGDKAWPLKVKVLKKEKVKVDAGTFDCFVVEPAVREGAGLFQAKGKLWVWLTADDRKLPVLMKSKIAVGSIAAELAEMKY
ncbi:MAG: DUF3108 domain-containing protein [Elusimicrobia bacterium]|nr:DUF3108 domain-containing protein [Elusimicrobiota bacterium]